MAKGGKKIGVSKIPGSLAMPSTFTPPKLTVDEKELPVSLWKPQITDSGKIKAFAGKGGKSSSKEGGKISRVYLYIGGAIVTASLITAIVIAAVLLTKPPSSSINGSGTTTTTERADARTQRGKTKGGHDLRVMTFNTWHGGSHVENGLSKIVKHISKVNPDIVGLQEVRTVAELNELVRLLGPGWSYIGRNQTRPDMGVLTRHTIIGPTPHDDASVRAKIRIQHPNGSSIVVNFWCLHLDYHDYGPYAACNRMVTAPYQIYAGEQYVGGSVPGRVQNIQYTANLPEFKGDLEKANEELMVVVGDLNCPSHLDWVESTKLIHCEWVYDWPVTKSLVDYGLTDAFREVHPDPAAVPADTWSTVEKFQNGWGRTIPEPQDRIDMVFYKSTRWAAVSAVVYSGNETITPIPNHWLNDWPSDHASVVVELQEK